MAEGDSLTIRAGKNNKLNFCSPKWPVWDPLFDPKFPPEKVYVDPFFCVLSQEMRHINFFLGPKWGVLGGGQKVYVEKVYVLFPSLKFAG